MKKTCLLLFLGAAACNAPATTTPGAPTTATPTPAASPAAVPVTTPLQQAVAAYIKANASTFPSYEPVRWSLPTPYTKMSEAAIKGVVAMKVFDDALVPRNKALADYKASQARHDKPAQAKIIEARYGKANKYNDSLLVIANSYLGVKDTTRLGTEIGHVYRTKNSAGAVVLDSTTFVVYRNGKVEQL